MDVGRWLARQRQHAVWQGLMGRQRTRLIHVIQSLCHTDGNSRAHGRPVSGAYAW
ncbi:hypothetical protein ACFVW9_19165 [Streptomyces sp. NPDC058217]|uniref:hypothetical protein n=1 Tax=Streptomyces sp. NPDC058217 TaxID=3346384 RepID=UPI0036E8F384